MITTETIRAAADTIRPYVRKTPMMKVAGTDFGLDHDMVLKLEHHQHTGSFKVRGAFHSLISGDVPKAGVVAASGGNHGAAVAFAAQRLGIPARIFVPEIAGPAKIGLIRSTGADLQVVSGAYADAYDASETYRAESGAMAIHAYDAPNTITGQGTLGKEIETQQPGLDVLLVAVGGGGLISGIASWYQQRIKIIAVEPTAAPTLARALEKGEATDVETGGIAANSLGARRIGSICLETCLATGIQSVLVEDGAIAAAQAQLWHAARIAAEPAGAAALAALTSGVYRPEPGARVGVLVCGGNMDPAPLPMPS